MNVVYELTHNQMKKLHHLYQQEWWSGDRTLEETIQCVDGSQICLALVDKDGELMGFARVLTDYTFKAIIFDVIVAKNHRELSLGDMLIKLIKGHEKLRRVRHFELYCLPEMHAFYEKHGFSDELGELILLRYIRE